MKRMISIYFLFKPNRKCLRINKVLTNEERNKRKSTLIIEIEKTYNEIYNEAIFNMIESFQVDLNIYKIKRQCSILIQKCLYIKILSKFLTFNLNLSKYF